MLVVDDVLDPPWHKPDPCSNGLGSACVGPMLKLPFVCAVVTAQSPSAAVFNKQTGCRVRLACTQNQVINQSAFLPRLYCLFSNFKSIQIFFPFVLKWRLDRNRKTKHTRPFALEVLCYWRRGKYKSWPPCGWNRKLHPSHLGALNSRKAPWVLRRGLWRTLSCLTSCRNLHPGDQNNHLVN